MKLIVSLYRTVDFGADWLLANIPHPALTDSTIETSLRERFGPLAPRFKIWRTTQKATAGIEVMTFDVDACDTPQAGLLLADPIDPGEIAMVDGALRSELERLGIPIEPALIQWRLSYQTKGN